jgi:NTE family protein
MGTGGTALVLSGTGAPAAYFGAGVIQTLETLGERPRVVSGVSTAAINAYALGAGLDGTALGRMWCRIGWHDVYRPRSDVWRAVNVGRLLRPRTNIAEYALGAIGWTWLLDTASLRQTLTRHLGRARIVETDDVTVVLSAVDEVTGLTMRFCSDLPPRHRRDPRFRQVDLTVDHVLASAAMPLLFRPGADDARTLVDAGLVAARPLAPVMRYEPDRVIVVSGAGISRPDTGPDSLGGAIALLVDNVARAALSADLDHARTVNRLVRAAPHGTVKRNVPILLIEPARPGFPLDWFLEFSATRARRVMDHGREQAGRVLAGWKPPE